MHPPELPTQSEPDLLVNLLDASHYAMTAQAAPHFIVALIAAVAGTLVWRWERGAMIGRSFALFALLFVVWACGRALLRMTESPDLAVQISRTFYVAVMLIVPALYEFLCLVMRRQLHRQHMIRINWIIGVLMALMAVTTPWIVAGTQVTALGLEPVHGLLGRITVVWVAATLALAMADALDSRRMAPPQSIERRRLSWFAGALGVLSLSIIDLLVASQLPLIALSFVPVAVFIILMAFITRRFGLVEVSTQMAADTLAELIRSALLIMDADGVVQVINQRTAAMFGVDPTTIVGRSAAAELGDTFALPTMESLAQNTGEEVEKEFIHRNEQTGETRDFGVSFVAVRDNRERPVAYIALVRDITDAKRGQQQRLSEGLRDGLTQLNNRTMFLGLLDAAVRQARGTSTGFAVYFVGLDRLRVINEDLGYAVGDSVLTTIGRRLYDNVEQSDSIARVGGDEFAVLHIVDSADSMEEMRTVAEALQRAISEPIQLEDHQLYVSASVGVATSEIPFTSGADALRSASVAMYKVKQQGGGKTHWITPDDMGGQRTRLESELRQGIANREFVVFYQPLVHLGDGSVQGLEALVRWQHPQRGLLGPMDFIEYAEELGLIAQIDWLVFEKVCEDYVDFAAACDAERFTISVNMAEAELSEPDFAARIAAQMAQHDLPNYAVRFELLERVALIGEARATLEALRDKGIGLCIDDFGTGYSSLSRLHELPITVLKIDRSFVLEMTRGDGGHKIITGILALANGLGLDVVAEGAGSELEARGLRALGCRMVQGFYFAKPLPKDEILDIISGPRPFRDKVAQLDAAPA